VEHYLHHEEPRGTLNSPIDIVGCIEAAGRKVNLVGSFRKLENMLPHTHLSDDFPKMEKNFIAFRYLVESH
jgi:hypothetical protein